MAGGSGISKEDWLSGLVRKARQNDSGRESVEVSLCSRTPGAQKQHQTLPKCCDLEGVHTRLGMDALIRVCF